MMIHFVSRGWKDTLKNIEKSSVAGFYVKYIKAQSPKRKISRFFPVICKMDSVSGVNKGRISDYT